MATQTIEQYEWGGQSRIRRMDVEKMPSGQIRVRLYPAKDGMRSLADVPEWLKEVGLGEVYPDAYKGENVLIVAGVKDPDRMITTLQHMELVEGTASAQHFPQAKQEVQQSFVDKVKLNSMQLSGAVGVPGHLALGAAGVMLKDWARVSSVPKSLAAPVILSQYGTGKGELEFEGTLSRMREYFEDGGIKLPELSAEDQKTGILKAANNVLSKYPLQIAFGLGAWGSVNWIQSAWREVKESKYKRGYGRMTAGVAGLASDLAVIFLPETSKRLVGTARQEANHIEAFPAGDAKPAKLMPDGQSQVAAVAVEEAPDKAQDNQASPEQGFIRRNAAYLIGSPLLLKGVLEFVNNIGWIANAAEETKKVKVWAGEDYMQQIDAVQSELDALKHEKGTVDISQKILDKNSELDRMKRHRTMAKGRGGRLFPFLTYTTGLCFLAATSLAAISSKNRDPAYLVPEAYEPLYATLSRILLEMPKQDRNETLELMAHYMSTEVDIRDGGIDVDTIKKEISKRVEVMEHSPWIDRGEQPMITPEQAPAQQAAAR